MIIKELFPGLQQVRERFLNLLSERLAELDTLCSDDAADPVTPEALRKAQDILHKIAGTAGTLGFQSLGEAANFSEEQIIGHLAEGKPEIQTVFRGLGAFAEHAEAVMSDADQVRSA